MIGIVVLMLVGSVSGCPPFGEGSKNCPYVVEEGKTLPFKNGGYYQVGSHTMYRGPSIYDSASENVVVTDVNPATGQFTALQPEPSPTDDGGYVVKSRDYFSDTEGIMDTNSGAITEYVFNPDEQTISNPDNPVDSYNLGATPYSDWSDDPIIDEPDDLLPDDSSTPSDPGEDAFETPDTPLGSGQNPKEPEPETAPGPVAQNPDGYDTNVPPKKKPVAGKGWTCNPFGNGPGSSCEKDDGSKEVAMYDGDGDLTDYFPPGTAGVSGKVPSSFSDAKKKPTYVCNDIDKICIDDPAQGGTGAIVEYGSNGDIGKVYTPKPLDFTSTVTDKPGYTEDDVIYNLDTNYNSFTTVDLPDGFTCKQNSCENPKTGESYLFKSDGSLDLYFPPGSSDDSGGYNYATSVPGQYPSTGVFDIDSVTCKNNICTNKKTGHKAKYDPETGKLIEVIKPKKTAPTGGKELKQPVAVADTSGAQTAGNKKVAAKAEDTHSVSEGTDQQPVQNYDDPKAGDKMHIDGGHYTYSDGQWIWKGDEKGSGKNKNTVENPGYSKESLTEAYKQLKSGGEPSGDLGKQKPALQVNPNNDKTFFDKPTECTIGWLCFDTDPNTPGFETAIKKGDEGKPGADVYSLAKKGGDEGGYVAEKPTGDKAQSDSFLKKLTNAQANKNKVEKDKKTLGEDLSKAKSKCDKGEGCTEYEKLATPDTFKKLGQDEAAAKKAAEDAKQNVESGNKLAELNAAEKACAGGKNPEKCADYDKKLAAAAKDPGLKDNSKVKGQIDKRLDDKFQQAAQDFSGNPSENAYVCVNGNDECTRAKLVAGDDGKIYACMDDDPNKCNKNTCGTGAPAGDSMCAPTSYEHTNDKCESETGVCAVIDNKGKAWDGTKAKYEDKDGKACDPKHLQSDVCKPVGPCKDPKEVGCHDSNEDTKLHKYWAPSSLTDFLSGGPATSMVHSITSFFGVDYVFWSGTQAQVIDQIFGYLDGGWISHYCSSQIEDVGNNGNSIAMSKTGQTVAHVEAEVKKIDSCFGIDVENCDNETLYQYKVTGLVDPSEVRMDFNIYLCNDRFPDGGNCQELYETTRELAKGDDAFSMMGVDTLIFDLEKKYTHICLDFKNLDDVEAFMWLPGSYGDSHRSVCSMIVVGADDNPYVTQTSDVDGDAYFWHWNDPGYEDSEINSGTGDSHEGLAID